MNAKQTLTLGIIFVLLAGVFAFIETAYFGWNLYPASKAEVICDLIAGLVSAIGYGLMAVGLIKGLLRYNQV